MNINKNKIYGLVVLLISYVCAYLAGLTLFNLLKNELNIFVVVLISDIVATIIIYFIGLLYKTASIYDPYWSLQSIAIGITLMVHYQNFDIGVIIYLVILGFYSVRLTYNFLVGFQSIDYIDWRYKMLKEKTKKWYFLVNLFGIHLFPTLLVYAATMPIIGYISFGYKFMIYDIFGYFVMLIGIFIELFADRSIKEFKKIRKSNVEILDKGLWSASRHPNYLGEIVFWYGVFFTFILHNLSYWYFIFGALLIHLMFIFISIPMNENHMMSYKRNYKSYKNKTRMLIPLKKRN